MLYGPPAEAALSDARAASLCATCANAWSTPSPNVIAPTLATRKKSRRELIAGCVSLRIGNSYRELRRG
jgi:hypothetical protein